MYKKYFEKFICSEEFVSVEQDVIYKRLIEGLSNELSEQAFLNIEELLHAEILLKMEIAFRKGFRYGIRKQGED